MILILLSWLYIFFTAAAFGIAFSKLLRIQQFGVVITPILGLFSITLLASAWAFFGPINLGFHVILTTLSVVFLYNSKEVVTTVFETLAQLNSFSFPIKILLIISSLLILAQSATLPFIIDNESYYIQTIKWLNEYGFVKGLANLHLFLGQTSGWHITQSVYSLSFLYDSYNDLNGFCLLLLNFFAFQKLNSYFTSGNRMDLVFGLLPLTYAFLFQFVSSPSPDLAVYILAFLIFATLLRSENKKDSFIIICILALYAVFIKITAVVLLALPLVLLIRHFRVLKSAFLKMLLVGTFVLLLFVLKNSTLTGYPLFPILCIRLDYLDYAVPNVIMDFFFSKSMLHSFYMPFGSYPDASVLTMFRMYFLNNGIAGYIGIASVVLLIVMPVVILKKSLGTAMWAIYSSFAMLVVLLIFSSPQYRFYVYFTLFFLLLLASRSVSKPKSIFSLYALSLMAVSILVFVPISFSKFTGNKLLGQNATFNLKNIVIPEPNSKWQPEYRGSSVGNMHFHTPIDTSFFWVTANGKLPCINTVQLEYFHKGFFYIPQQRSIELKNGFYSQKVGISE